MNFRLLFIVACALACLVGSSASAQIVEPRPEPVIADEAASEDESSEPLALDSEDTGRREIKIQTARLTARDPIARLRAAEQLARFSAVGERRMIEGYRFQEKDKRVQLALDWALYRTGDATALTRITDALTSSARRAQAVSYLSKLDSPLVLYPFLDSPKREIKIGVIEVLGRIGDVETRAHLEKAIETNRDMQIVIAANDALNQLDDRTVKNSDAAPSRPRRVNE